MNPILLWYTRNYTQITWFIIGWMSMCKLVDFSKGDWPGVIFDIILIVINYLFVKR